MNDTVEVAVIIPTHAPHAGRLSRTLDGLMRQRLSKQNWELIVVDNGSPEAVKVDLAWHPHARMVREDRLGLTYARLTGAAAARGAVLVFVDDDNVLDECYLERVCRIFAESPKLGAIGGKSMPEWEREPEAWVAEFAGNLALRDLGEEILISDPTIEKGYPPAAPIGAGMAIRREAWEVYASRMRNDSEVSILDRRGNALTSGGDNDIIMNVFRAGWQVGYFPELRLHHLIPEGRTTKDYLARLNHGIARSWVQVLDRHGIRPWPRVPKWSVWLRKWRAYFKYRAWRDPASYIRWKGASGQFEGRTALRRKGVDGNRT